MRTWCYGKECSTSPPLVTEYFSEQNAAHVSALRLGAGNNSGPSIIMTWDCFYSGHSIQADSYFLSHMKRLTVPNIVCFQMLLPSKTRLPSLVRSPVASSRTSTIDQDLPFLLEFQTPSENGRTASSQPIVR